MNTNEIDRIFSGLMYHMTDMVDYLEKHSNDKFFETEEGTEIKRYMFEMCKAHSLWGLTMIVLKMKEKVEETDHKNDMEDALKDAFNKKDEE